eukprot:Polyplicarium_translucidae@DN2456_c0_g1_i4.p1
MGSVRHLGTQRDRQEPDSVPLGRSRESLHDVVQRPRIRRGGPDAMSQTKRMQLDLIEKMQRQQRNFSMMLEENAVDGSPEEDGRSVDDDSAPSKESTRGLYCVLCHESGAGRPFGFVGLVSHFGVMRRLARKGKAGLPHRSPVASTCGHVGHIECLIEHQRNVRKRALDGEFFFVRAKVKSEYPCPMCRSLSNCVIPYITTQTLVDMRRVDGDYKLRWTVPEVPRHDHPQMGSPPFVWGGAFASHEEDTAMDPVSPPTPSTPPTPDAPPPLLLRRTTIPPSTGRDGALSG